MYVKCYAVAAHHCHKFRQVIALQNTLHASSHVCGVKVSKVPTTAATLQIDTTITQASKAFGRHRLLQLRVKKQRHRADHLPVSIRPWWHVEWSKVPSLIVQNELGHTSRSGSR